MFRRTFWFTAGAAAGVWATAKVNQKIKQLTPESLAAQAANRAVEAGHRIKDFAADVRTGMVRREAELGEALGIEAEPARGLPPAGPRQVRAVEAGPARGAPRSGRGPAPRGRGPHPFNEHNRNEDH
ncbi:hypothetical protein [Streptomyces fuscigenes]|uniref:hypothetical protein n=1 Tax=Streptomyces fuscigenes TaxID=1528880 RepID=UPI001F2D33C2|nr:hypothetical protein [Streptomyces fuscigenes]MCF3962563.1 hypothetical protein [Streptomyces fuscigenes]